MLSPEQWLKLSPYLDEALGMTDEERSTWLPSLQRESPELAARLQLLFHEQRALSEEGFLEQRVVAWPGETGLAGQTLGVYTLIEQIGQGGMGSVWLAERNDGRFQRRVAVKFPNIALLGKSGEERFKREGRILGLLIHPHIAELIDAGVSQSRQPYLILEHIEGDHIDRYCDQHRLRIEARIRLFLDVLRAVARAHANLIVHRDLKPSNVLVRNDGQAKLLDFGIAKLLEVEGHAGEGQLTIDGVRAMTPECAAPEQLLGRAITTATDIYALGVLLYVLLTGRHPAGEQRTAVDLVKAIVDLEAPRPSGRDGSRGRPRSYPRWNSGRTEGKNAAEEEAQTLPVFTIRVFLALHCNREREVSQLCWHGGVEEQSQRGLCRVEHASDLRRSIGRCERVCHPRKQPERCTSGVSKISPRIASAVQNRAVFTRKFASIGFSGPSSL